MIELSETMKQERYAICRRFYQSVILSAFVMAYRTATAEGGMETGRLQTKEVSEQMIGAAF
jgi:hypothetical protein